MYSIKRFFFKYKKMNYKMNIFIEIVGNCGAYICILRIIIAYILYKNLI